MFGRSSCFKSLKLGLGLLLINLFGCNNIENIPEKEKNILDIGNQKLSLIQREVKRIEEIQMKDADQFLIENSILYPYIEGINFVPSFLSDENVLFGYARNEANPEYTFALAYDLNNQVIKKLKNTDVQTYVECAVVQWSDSKQAFIEKVSLINGVHSYVLYDLHDDSTKEIIRVENSYLSYPADLDVNEDVMMLNYHDGEKYKLVSYSLTDSKLKEVENSNCAYPTYFAGFWYYIKIDNTKKITQLVRYDSNLDEKRVIYEMQGSNNYLSGLVADENNLVLTTVENDITICYRVDLQKTEIVPLFKSNYMGSLQMKNGYLTWIGQQIIPNRSRLQNYLYNIDEDIHYLYKDGSIYLSENAMLWVDYLKEENEIMKGESLNSLNSQLRYKKLK